MRLADFILENMEKILQAWEDFAKTISPSTEAMGTTELRDHAEQMLQTIAADLRTPQTTQEQVTKSHGDGPRESSDTAAEDHATARLISGFTLDQMVSEYRALRTSVLLLWAKHASKDAEFQEQDTIRFHEAIDQALAESVASYSAMIKESQDVFLAILGHDLRTPLGAITLGAEVLLRSEGLGSREIGIAARIYASVNRAGKMVENLLDFTRSHLGGGIPVVRIETDLTTICGEIVEEVRAYHVEHPILFEPREAVIGSFDAARMEQVFSNLISNAVQHGAENSPVTVALKAAAGHAMFTVHNEGEPIAARVLPYIFSPMSRHSRFASRDHARSAGLGLGLYIANAVVAAHGGKIEVDSHADRGTTFVVKIPL
jgi:signal transduction histidine kinase